MSNDTTTTVDPRTRAARVKIGRGLPQVYSFLCSPKGRELQAQVGNHLLDLGCGYGQGLPTLSEAGWCWRGADLVDRVNIPEMFINLKDLRDYSYHFSVVCLSNVVNVQQTPKQLVDLINSAVNALRDGGFLVWNYPGTPRYMPDLGLEEMRRAIKGAVPWVDLIEVHRDSLLTVYKKREFRDGHGR